MERFSDEKWTEASKKINPSRILYVTKDIQDEKLNSYGMTEIIWTRYYSQMNKSYDKISIPFIPDNYGKMEEMGNKKLETKIKEDGFSTKQEITVARVRGYREGRHGSEKWANRTTFTEATDLFIIRAIPGTKLSTDMTILCDDENFEITSIEDVKGKNMYIEILAKKVIQNG